MGILSGDPKEEPMHAGEVYHLWTHLFESKAFLVTLQVLNNHTGDVDLKKFLKEYSESCIEKEEEQIESLLKENGLRLPPAPPDRPMVNISDIPAGARFNDPEVAALVGKEIMSGKILCSYIMSMSIREDIAQMYNEFHKQRVEQQENLLKINKQKGWLVPPPLNT
ncbi:DUF3231 family protein [Bacillus sp. B15-48]|uniref:DUF3231 family protein n=1 Tax=Bacillus sp. B15-48 TaxID=1548601 RepID=UPI00193F0D48|nr:DUF3231 family protein [Bacillus sp. B15-48]MBM4763431.1 DUF3231 family protein [Bacillus sp. B15-48]